MPQPDANPYAVCLPPARWRWPSWCLFTAALLLRSLPEAACRRSRFPTDHLLAVKIDLPDNLYATSSAGRNFFHPPAGTDRAPPRSHLRRHHQRFPLTPSRVADSFCGAGRATTSAWQLSGDADTNRQPARTFGPLASAVRAGRWFTAERCRRPDRHLHRQ